jgi:maltose alpha-D-glucosyltransferase/alpha-amylase
MLRSFDCVAQRALLRELELGTVRERDLASLQPSSRFWCAWVSSEFLKSYLQVMRQSDLLPESGEEFSLLLEALLLEKAVYEIGYELKNRPDWIGIPLRGVVQLLGGR